MVPACGRAGEQEISGPTHLPGDDVFLDRLAQPFQFEAQSTASKLRTIIAVAQRLNAGNWIGHLIVAAQGYYPIYLTLRREQV